MNEFPLKSEEYLRAIEAVLSDFELRVQNLNSLHLFDVNTISEEIRKYCKDNGYEFVWFCRDIEDVFWDEQIPKDDKTAKAAQFRSSKRIKTLQESKLSRFDYARHYSNIVTVLEKHIERK